MNEERNIYDCLSKHIMESLEPSSGHWFFDARQFCFAEDNKHITDKHDERQKP